MTGGGGLWLSRKETLESNQLLIVQPPCFSSVEFTTIGHQRIEIFLIQWAAFSVANNGRAHVK